MTLIQWVKNEFKNGVELFSDKKIITGKNGVTLTKDCARLRECSLGLISSSSAEEWYNICRLNSEPGTIIEQYTDDWIQLYNDYTSLARNSLTKALLNERNSKSAELLLKILERRDRQHWYVEGKTTKLDVKNDNKTTNVTFTIVE